MDFRKIEGEGGYPLKISSVLTHLLTALWSFVTIFLIFLFFLIFASIFPLFPSLSLSLSLSFFFFFFFFFNDRGRPPSLSPLAPPLDKTQERSLLFYSFTCLWRHSLLVLKSWLLSKHFSIAWPAVLMSSFSSLNVYLIYSILNSIVEPSKDYKLHEKCM